MANSIEFQFGTQADPQPLSLASWNERPRWKQVHGVAVVEVTHSQQECGEVDALWTRQKNLPVAVVTADCVPILLYRKDAQAVGVIHAGWRGTVARIADHFFKALPTELANPRDWCAKLGPSIHGCCYEVSAELIEQFVLEFTKLSRKEIEPAPRKLDLVAINVGQLRDLGVSEMEIHPDCTFCAKNGENARYFSYRRGDRKSRMYSSILLK
jgi:YfiH family protein